MQQSVRFDAQGPKQSLSESCPGRAAHTNPTTLKRYDSSSVHALGPTHGRDVIPLTPRREIKILPPQGRPIELYLP